MPLAGEDAWAWARSDNLLDPRRDILVVWERTHIHQIFETSNTQSVSDHLQPGDQSKLEV